MFDVRCKGLLPLDYVEVTSVSVRGDLGPMAVFCTREAASFEGRHGDPSAWAEVYRGDHAPSMQAMVPLRLAEPFRVRAGETRGVYVHSARSDSDGEAPDSVVYASQRSFESSSDSFLAILPGMAHTSPTPFSDVGYWPFGSAWRPYREFVGSVEFGVRFACWNPDRLTHARFPRMFREMVRHVLLCHARTSSLLGRIPLAALHYILNMCAWDWAYFPGADALLCAQRDASLDARHDLRGELVACRDVFAATVHLARGTIATARSRAE